jgi:hypothetical protein
LGGEVILEMLGRKTMKGRKTMNRGTSFLLVALMVLMIGCSRAPDEQQIKADLIGHRMGSVFGGGWNFSSLTEFQELTIINKNQQGNLIEFDVNMLLKDSSSGKLYHAESIVVYKKSNGKWELASISKKSLKPAH